MYYYGARYYDPRISIFVSVDPLAEKYPGWTPYHYVHNSPVNMVDPTGMEGEGWIEWSTKKGDKQMTYDSQITTKEEAIKKGYTNVKDVHTGGYYNDDNDNYHLREDGYITQGSGGFIDTHNNETLRSTDGTFFSKNKTGIEQLLEVTGAFGDGLTYIGYGISLSGAGAPIGLGVAGVGGLISELATGGSIINDLSNENYVGAVSNASGLIISKSIGKAVDKKIQHEINGNFNIGNSIIKQNIGMKTKFLIEEPAKKELKKQMLNE